MRDSLLGDSEPADPPNAGVCVRLQQHRPGDVAGTSLGCRPEPTQRDELVRSAPVGEVLERGPQAPGLLGAGAGPGEREASVPALIQEEIARQLVLGCRKHGSAARLEGSRVLLEDGERSAVAIAGQRSVHSARAFVLRRGRAHELVGDEGRVVLHQYRFGARRPPRLAPGRVSETQGTGREQGDRHAPRQPDPTRTDWRHNGIRQPDAPVSKALPPTLTSSLQASCRFAASRERSGSSV